MTTGTDAGVVSNATKESRDGTATKRLGTQGTSWYSLLAELNAVEDEGY